MVEISVIFQASNGGLIYLVSCGWFIKLQGVGEYLWGYCETSRQRKHSIENDQRWLC